MQSGQGVEWLNSEDRQTCDCRVVMEELGERENVDLMHLVEQFNVRSF